MTMLTLLKLLFWIAYSVTVPQQADPLFRGEVEFDEPIELEEEIIEVVPDPRW